MKTKKFAEMTTEELVKTEKTSKGVTYAFVILLILLLGANVFLVLKKGFGPLQIIPFTLLPLLFLNFYNLKQIKKELKSREN